MLLKEMERIHRQVDTECFLGKPYHGPPPPPRQLMITDGLCTLEQ